MAELANDKRKYLNPDVISKLDNMQLRARLVVEGFIIGLHKSPYHGFSVEFAEHRPYMQGDEIRHIDWKLYAKTDRYYIKQYEEETNLKSYLLIDKSGSMKFKSGNISKLEYASYLAASLGYLMMKQQDGVSLTLFDESVHTHLPPLSKKSHLNLILEHLNNIEPGAETSIAPVLHTLADKIKKRGLIILISDLMDEPEEVLNGLKHFRHKGHEIILFHIMDPAEIAFDYKKQTRFIDMENNKTIVTDPWHIQTAYRQAVDRFIQDYKFQCLKNNIDYLFLTTDQNLDKALIEYLNKRAKIG